MRCFACGADLAKLEDKQVTAHYAAHLHSKTLSTTKAQNIIKANEVIALSLGIARGNF